MTQGFGKDDSVRAVVYRGAGTEAFASGADISEFPESRKDAETAQRYNAHHRRRLRGDARVSEADRRDDLRLLHGRRDGARDGVRPALRRRGLEVRHPGGATEHRLSLGGDRPARRPRRARLREGHPLLGAHRERSRGAGHRLHPAAGAGRRSGAHDLRLPAARRRQRAAVRARHQGHDRVLPRGLRRRAAARRLRALSLEAASSEDYQEGTRAFLEKRPPRSRGAEPALVRFEFLSSTPAEPHRGQRHLRRARRPRPRPRRRSATTSAVRPLGRRTGFHTLDRWLYNARVARRRPRADVVVGRRPRRLPVGARRRGGARLRRRAQGHHRRRAAQRARVVRMLLRHPGALGAAQHRARRSGDRAEPLLRRRRPRRSTACPRSELAVVPEPIDLAEWRRRFAAAAPAPRRPARPC